MSPLSVAQFLPPGRVSFDLLVIDEASQVSPEDALGVVARAKQIVVVGDDKQLPPTNFFKMITAGNDYEEEDNEEALRPDRPSDFESILTLARTRGMSERMLAWHYRSKHPSLIALSKFVTHKTLPTPLGSARSYEGARPLDILIAPFRPWMHVARA